MSTRLLAFLLFLLAFQPLLTLNAAQSEEAFYDSRFPRDCSRHEIPAPLKQQMKATLRSEFKKQNAEIEQIGVLDIQCVQDSKRQVLGAIVLGYGLVRDPIQAHVLLGKSIDIQTLLKQEQFGVFQFDASFIRLRKTITTFPSQRWLDYQVKMELQSVSRLVVSGQGSYGDSRMRREFSIVW